MTHCEFGVDLLNRLEDYADNDDCGRTAEGEKTEARVDCRNCDRKNCDNAEYERADKCYSVEYLNDVIRCGLAGADAGDNAAVSLEVVGNLDGIETIPGEFWWSGKERLWNE